jgi:hypothetical protein
MTTPSTPRKAGPYLGDGTQTTWTFEFKVFAESDIAVTIADAVGDETLLTLNSDYTVTLNDNQETSPGGEVTYPLPPGPGEDPVPNLPTGARLAILGNIAYEQTLDIPSGGNFSPIALENQLDRTTMQVQQLAEELSRAVRVPLTYDAAELVSFTADVVRLADSADNIDLLAANVDNVNAVGDDLRMDPSNVITVSENIDHVAAASGAIPEISVIAADLAGTGYDYDLGSITTPTTGTGASPDSAIITVVTNIANVQAVAANGANIDAVAANEDNINAVVANETNIDAVAANEANVNAAVANATNINAVVANEANIDIVAGINADVTTVATNIADVQSVVTNLAAIIAAPTEAANAASSANDAAASASAAAAIIASGMYSAVQDKNTNYTVVEADAGDLIRVDTSGGSRTITLPAISTVDDGFKVSVVKWTDDSSGVTVARSGSDTINGGTDFVLTNQYNSATFVADAETNEWFAAGAGAGSANIVVDRFSGNGSTTAFTLSGNPGSENNTQVFIGGVYQQKDGYSQSAATLTFGVAPPSGTNNIEVVWTQPTAIGVPSDNTVTAAKLVDGAVVAHLGYTPLNAASPSYTGTLTGGTGVVNLGSGQVYKDASGNVGIGTSSPSSKLNVNGFAQFTGDGTGAPSSGTGIEISGAPNGAQNRILAFNRGASTWQVLDIGAASLTFTTNFSERLRIEADGDVVNNGVFYYNARTITASITLSATDNAMSIGPIIISDPAVVTVPEGGDWAIL